MRSYDDINLTILQTRDYGFSFPGRNETAKHPNGYRVIRETLRKSRQMLLG